MDKLVQEFLEVFSGQVATMKGEKFTDDAVCESPKNSIIFVTEGGITAETKNHRASHRSRQVVCTYCGGTKEGIRLYSDAR